MLQCLAGLLLLGAQNGYSLLGVVLHRKGDCFALVLSPLRLGCWLKCLLGHELMEVLVKLPFVFEAKCDVFMSLANLIDRKDLSPTEQPLYSFCLGVQTFQLCLTLKQARQISVALLVAAPLGTKFLF